MFHLIPRPLHRAALNAAHALRRVWWRWRKPLLLGCRVLAFDERGKLLLIRHSYGSGRWMLPGGGLGRREDPLAAGMRELAEEVSLGLADAVVIDCVDEPLYGTTNRVHVIAGRAFGAARCDGREVIELGYFDPEALPQPLSPALARRLDGWVKTAAIALRLPQPAG